MRKGAGFPRFVIAALTTMIALSLPFATPSEVQAACGTAWTNKKEPPPDIRVLRTDSGKVEKVGFRRYVAVVMASGEWPTTLSDPVLEAGAHAVKQYAWYYALKGNHRSSYKNGNGKCYDVRDDSNDQVYNPEEAEPTDKQKKARDALWGLSLRKKGDFLLTGYRSGTKSKCAADADGWHLYTKSSKDCVRSEGFEGTDILRAYYSPKLEFVWAPGTEPATEEFVADAEEPATEEPETDEADADEPSADASDADTSDPEETGEANSDGASPSGPLDSISAWIGGVFAALGQAASTPEE